MKFSAILASSALIAVVACGKKSSSDDNRTVQPEKKPEVKPQQPSNQKKEETKVAPVSPKVAPSEKPNDNKAAEPTVAPEVVRGEVISTLKLSYDFEKAMRNSNKNPSKIRAQLVQYRNPSKQLSWEMLEISEVAQGDVNAVAKPFYILETKMKTDYSLNGKVGIARVVIADIKTQFTDKEYKNVEIGAFLLSDDLLDLCTTSQFDSLCRFDFSSTKGSFDIYSYLR